MPTADVIELDKHPDDHEEISDQTSQGSKKPKLSNIYELWRFEQAGKRDATYHGAQCIPCKQVAEKKGLPLNPTGTCLADIRAMLAHVKNCEHQQKADKQRAATELQTRRAQPVKRGFVALQAKEAVSSGSSRQPGMSSFMALVDKPLSDMEQTEFEQLCLQATISGNVPLQIWDDPAFRKLLQFLRPKVTIPTRKVMSTRILDAGYKIAEDGMKVIVSNSDGVCIATDSWTSIRQRQIMAFVLITAAREVLPHRSLETTAERHFGENLREHMLEEIQIVEEVYNTKVKAIITDAASDCRKARRLVVDQHPHILSLDCFAHQMNLLVGSYLKYQDGAAEAMKQGYELINWWRWHLVPFEWLLAEMDTPIALLTGCLTRWGSQVAAIIRLLQFKTAMGVVLFRRKDEILDTIAKKDQRQKADAILSVAQRDSFWSALAHLVQNLLPVRIALRVLESDSARLDTVLEQFGHMAHHFSYSQHMMVSLEKRWAKMDQKLFLVAYVLHPARMLQHINQDLEFAYANNIATYASQLYQRLFKSSDAEKARLFKQTATYLAMQGAFASSLPNYTDTNEDPSVFWSLMRQQTPELARLAMHLASIAVNSAGVERLFSAFLNVQTKRRNKLLHQRVHKIAAIKAMLPARPRKKQKAAGAQYLGSKPVTRATKLPAAAAKQLQTEAAGQTEQQFVDGAQDMLTEAQQVEDMVQGFCEQIDDDEEDDDEYIAAIPGTTRCLLADLFVNMPAFDLNLLFEDEIDPAADPEAFDSETDE